MKFKIGDVVMTHWNPKARGKVVHVGTDGYVAVNFFDKTHGCGFSVNGKDYFGWWLHADEWELCKTTHPAIVITTDGVKTTAKLRDGKRVIKSAEAKCSPSDTFNFNVGAQLAFNRLVYGTDYNPAEVALKPKPKTEDKPKEPVKLYCVKDYEPGIFLTRGKIYDVSDGKIIYDDGWSTVWTGSNHLVGEDGTQPVSGHHSFPLVSRPAKVGEWVLVTSVRPNSEHVSYLRVGEIRIVDEVDTGMRPTRTVANEYGRDSWLYEDEYMVLDGYDGRYETPAPKEMTVAEIEKQLGYPVKVVKGEANA